jgi:hypothetical protein
LMAGEGGGTPNGPRALFSLKARAPRRGEEFSYEAQGPDDDEG